MRYISMMRNSDKIKYAKLYRDYLIDFLTVEKFAEYYNFSHKKSWWIINQGRKYHEQGY